MEFSLSLSLSLSLSFSIIVVWYSSEFNNIIGNSIQSLCDSFLSGKSTTPILNFLKNVGNGNLRDPNFVNRQLQIARKSPSYGAAGASSSSSSSLPDSPTSQEASHMRQLAANYIRQLATFISLREDETKMVRVARERKLRGRKKASTSAAAVELTKPLSWATSSTKYVAPFRGEMDNSPQSPGGSRKSSRRRSGSRHVENPQQNCVMHADAEAKLHTNVLEMVMKSRDESLLKLSYSSHITITRDVTFGVCASLPRDSSEKSAEMYRSFNIINIGQRSLGLVSVMTRPASSDFVTLHDDYGVAIDGSVHEMGTGDEEKKATPIVELDPNEEYEVTVKLDRRTVRLGSFQQWVLFTFVFLDELNNVTRKQKPGKTSFVIGRRVSGCICINPRDVMSCSLSVEATPFIPESLLFLFDKPPTSFFSTLLNHHFFRKPTGARFAVTAPATTNAILATMMSGETAAIEDVESMWRQPESPASLIEQTVHETSDETRRQATLLLLEALALERHVIGFDQFNVYVTPIAVNAKTRRWESTLKKKMMSSSALDSAGVNSNEKEFAMQCHGRYGGSLTALEGTIPFVLKMSSLLEGKPALAMFDSVHIRLASKSDFEVGGLVVSLDGEFCIFVVSEEAAMCLTSMGVRQSAPLIRPVVVHLRFISSDNALRQMNKAMTRAVSHPTCVLPSHDTATSSLTGDCSSSSPVKMRAPAGVPEGGGYLSEEDMNHLGVNREQGYAVKRFADGCANWPDVPPWIAADSGTQHTTSTNTVSISGNVELDESSPSSSSVPRSGKRSYGKNCDSSAFAQFESARSAHSRIFVVQGPPGTGKTRTVIACIEHVIQRRTRGKQTRILACAPTDFAADILAEGLLRRGIPGVLRMNDPRRFAATVKDGVLECCLFDDVMQVFRWPSLDELYAANVVVSTCISSGTVFPALNQGITFSHIVVDEAGQALVPEILVPVSMASPDTFVALVGDPRQLGPAVHSRVAARWGLGCSLLERWITFYSNVGVLVAGQPSIYGCCLVRNYRSRAALLELPSRLFYGNQLIACVDEEDTRMPDLSGWKGLENTSGESVNSRAALYFNGCLGQQSREPDSPSYYNALEAAHITSLIESLLAVLQGKVLVSDIGVMATYRLQVRKIRSLLRSRGLGGIRVGTVDDYQGQEEKIIFISTVITSAQIVTPLSPSSSSRDDTTSTSEERAFVNNYLGNFISNEKRFNVAITRARAMLVVVGHPATLRLDSNWERLIECTIQNNAYTGAGKEAFGNGTRLYQPSLGVTDSAAECIAKLSLDTPERVLGPGNLQSIFPDSLDDIYDIGDSYADDELACRVML